MEEKIELGRLCIKYNKEYDEINGKGKAKVSYSDKRHKHTKQLPRPGYLDRALREFYPDLNNLKV